MIIIINKISYRQSSYVVDFLSHNYRHFLPEFFAFHFDVIKSTSMIDEVDVFGAKVEIAPAPSLAG